MSRKKTPFSAYMTDTCSHYETSFVRIGNSVVHNKKWQGLSDKAKTILLLMWLYAGRSGNSDIWETTFSRENYKDIATVKSFTRAKKELINAGFIEEKENNRLCHRKNVYRFMEDWKSKPT